MITLKTDTFLDHRTRVRKRSHISFTMHVLINGHCKLIASHCVPVTKCADGSWVVTQAGSSFISDHNSAHVAQLSRVIGVDPAAAERILRDHAIKSFYALERYRNSDDGDVPDILYDAAYDAAGQVTTPDTEQEDADPALVDVTIVDTIPLSSIPTWLPDRDQVAAIQAFFLRHQYVKAIGCHNAGLGVLAVRVVVGVVDSEADDVGSRPLISIVGDINDEAKLRRKILDCLPSKTRNLELLREIADQKRPMAA